MTKNYNVIDTIAADAPYGNVNWCTISFFTPNKLDSLKNIQVAGFKVHNGYNTSEQAESDARKIREKQANHDVFVLEMGQIYPWDDATRSDNVEYSNKKMSKFEFQRRENADKARLLSEQLANDSSKADGNTRLDRQRERLKKKLLSRNIVSKRDMEVLESKKQVISQTPPISPELANDIIKTLDTDYLDANDPTGLKYGCITIFSSDKIGGLKLDCFKIRGMSDNIDEINARSDSLKKTYPHDQIAIFEVGKWMCRNIREHTVDPLAQLNYSMKMYLQHLDKLQQDFDKRKERDTSKAERAKDRNVKKNKKNKKKRTARNAGTTVSQSRSHEGHYISDADRSQIDELFNYINDDSLQGKYAIDDKLKTTMNVNI